MKQNRALWQLLLLDGVLLALVGLALPLLRWMLAALPDCYVAQMGLACPACGGTRAVSALFRGDLIAAVRLNPLVVLALVYVLLVLVALHMEVLFRLKWAHALRKRMTDYRVIIGWTIATAIFTLVRNIV